MSSDFRGARGVEVRLTVEIVGVGPMNRHEVIKFISDWDLFQSLLDVPVDTSESDSECDLPFCDNYVTFSNPLFNDNDDFTSSDDESLPEEDVPKENFKIYSNPLFEFDDEFTNMPLSKLNEDECFDPGGDFVLEEIEACLTSDSIPPGIDDDDFDQEGDILLLEKLLNDVPSSPLPPKELNLRNINLLIKDTILNLPPEVFLDRDPRSLEDELDKDDLKNMLKVFDPGIHKEIISPTYVSLNPFVEIPSGEIKVHIEVLSVLWENRLPIPDGSLPLSSLQKGRGSPGRNKTPGPWSARIPMWYKGLKTKQKRCTRFSTGGSGSSGSVRGTVQVSTRYCTPQYEVAMAGQSEHDTCPKCVIQGCQACVSPR
ncbi:hypothetical protein Tco_1482456 [Tanacetum coccineum]